VSYYMTTFSAFAFIAYGEIAYLYGWVAVTWVWTAIPACLVAAFWIAPLWRRARVFTPVEFLETRYGAWFRQLFAWSGFPLRIADNGLRLYSLGVFVAVATTRLPSIAIVAVVACGPNFAPPETATVPVVSEDSAGLAFLPPGYGTLRQDEIAIRLQPPGVVVRAIPLEEALIRLLTPDSYRTLRDLRMSVGTTLNSVSRRLGGRPVESWLVSFFGVEPEVRFTPMDLIITSAGRDFRPLEVIPLSAGFGEQRLRQRETQSAIYVFDADVEVDQPLTVSFMTDRSEIWEQLLPRIERERALVRARASRSTSP
jgi:hypothetical protein